MAKVAVVLAVALACLIASAAAGNLISNAFGDNMVLAGGQNTQIWGWTMQDSNIVKLQMTSDQNVTKTYVTTSSNFKWIMTLNEPSGFTTWKIVVTTVFQAATIKNVVFGTVYICGGQSNMQMAVSGAFNSSTEVPQGDFYPFIRLFTAGQGTNSSVPLDEFRTIEQPWTVSSSKAIGGGDWSTFSALCWFTGRDMFKKLNVPVGLMSINWGGTYIQTWASSTVTTYCGNTQVWNPPNQPQMLYNAMLNPIFGMTINAVFWYQGEANVGSAELYKCLFNRFIVDWRQRQNPGGIWFPFVFVQLSAYTQGLNVKDSTKLAELRQAQMSALPAGFVSAVTAIDLGDLTSPLGNIHPRDKQTIAQRIVRRMQRAAEGWYGYAGPEALWARLDNFNPTGVIVTFLQNSFNFPPLLRSAECPPSIAGFCAGFEIQGSDKIWRAADARNSWNFPYDIHLNTSLPAGVVPIGARYAYAAWPLNQLTDAEGNPAFPFVLEL